jgi:hypothetical protein
MTRRPASLAIDGAKLSSVAQVPAGPRESRAAGPGPPPGSGAAELDVTALEVTSWQVKCNARATVRSSGCPAESEVALAAAGRSRLGDSEAPSRVRAAAASAAGLPG